MNVREGRSPRVYELYGPRLQLQLTDFEEGQGRLTILADGRAWTTCWGAMGGPIRQFLAGSCCSYVISNLNPPLDAQQVDWYAVSDWLKGKLKERTDLSEDNREVLEAEIDSTGAEEWQHDRASWQTMCQITRLDYDELTDELPREPNPEYQQLERLVRAVINFCRGDAK